MSTAHGTNARTVTPLRSRSAPILTAEEFAGYLTRELSLDGYDLAPGARLVDDLGFDSLQMLELALVLDEMGASLDAEELSRMFRVGDLYRLYVERRTLSHYSELACEGPTPPWPASTTPPHVSSAPLVSRRTRQRPVVVADYAFLAELERRDAGSVLGRRPARAVSPEDFPAAFWDGALARHLILDLTCDAPVGLVGAHDADLVNGHARIRVAVESRLRGRGWPLEAFVLFVNYVFGAWPLRKLYLEVRGASVPAIASGLERIFVEEGRLVGHEYANGGWTDVHVFSIFRERWEADAQHLLGRVLGTRPTSRPADPSAC